MKKLLTSCSLVILVLTASAITLADIAKPKTTPQNTSKVALHTGLEIAVDPKGGEASELYDAYSTAGGCWLG